MASHWIVAHQASPNGSWLAFGGPDSRNLGLFLGGIASNWWGLDETEGSSVGVDPAAFLSSSLGVRGAVECFRGSRSPWLRQFGPFGWSWLTRFADSSHGFSQRGDVATFSTCGERACSTPVLVEVSGGIRWQYRPPVWLFPPPIV